MKFMLDVGENTSWWCRALLLGAYNVWVIFVCFVITTVSNHCLTLIFFYWLKNDIF